jgi:hypothetical protein
MTPPFFEHDPGLLQGIEDHTIEQFIPKLRVEALAIAIFPGGAGFDVGVGFRMIALTLDVWHCSPGGRFFVT